jgi:hypothetical protein
LQAFCAQAREFNLQLHSRQYIHIVVDSTIYEETVIVVPTVVVAAIYIYCISHGLAATARKNPRSAGPRMIIKSPVRAGDTVRFAGSRNK